MAASARYASLSEQRRAGNTALTGGKILAPVNTSITSIAKTNFKNELNAMVQQYNDGVVGNEEMRSFLEGNKNNPGISETDRLDIQNQIRDFDVRIVGDRLQAKYDAAPKNSITRVAAARDLASFYASRATSLAEGTPAQSTALQNKAAWEAKAATEQDAIEKYSRQITRAQMEQQVNTIPSGTSDNAAARAEMYQQLAQQASADGSEVEAQRYMAQANAEITRAQVLVESEAKKAEADFARASKKEIVDLLNSLANDYHDGKIAEDQYMFALSQIDPKITELGDTALALTFNRTVDTVQKNIERGGLNTSINQWGLPVKNGYGTGTAPIEAVQDFAYNDNLKTAQEMLAKGEISPDTYTEGVGELVQQHYQELTDRATKLEAIARENPNTYLSYNGKRQRAVDILEQVNREVENLSQDFSAIQSGQAKLMIIPPDQFNTSGKISKSGKDYATYRLIDPENIPANQRDQFAQDEYGNYHPITRSQINVQPTETDLSLGYFTDTTGAYGPANQTYRLNTDQSGNTFIYGQQQAEVYQPGTNKKVVSPVNLQDGKLMVPSFEQGSGARGLTAAPEVVQATGQVTPAVLPKPQEFEQAIQPKAVNLDLSKPTPGLDFMTPTPQMPQVKPVNTPAPQPVNLNVQKLPQGLTEMKPAAAPKTNIQVNPLKDLATKVGSVISDSPFNFLKKKLFGG